MIPILAGVGIVVGVGFTAFDCWRLWKRQRQLDRFDEQLDQCWAELQRLHQEHVRALDARLHRLETSTSVLAEGYDEMAHDVEWIGSWVRNWVATLQERRQ